MQILEQRRMVEERDRDSEREREKKEDEGGGSREEYRLVHFKRIIDIYRNGSSNLKMGEKQKLR